MKLGLQAFTYHPSELSAIGLLLWTFRYMKWHTKLVKIGVNRKKINQLLQDFKIKMKTLLTVLFFPSNRRTCILTKSVCMCRGKSSTRCSSIWMWYSLSQMVKLPLHEVLQPASTEIVNNFPYPSCFVPPYFKQWAEFS